MCSVTYLDFNKAIQLCLKAGKSCYIGKSDFTSAFRNLGIRESQWKFLILKAESPLDNRIYYFVDKCLPFGASISCSHFQAVSVAIAHLVVWRTQKDLVNYLDDYLFVALLRIWCDNQIRVFMQVCAEIRFPVSLEKTCWSGQVMIFLGMLIDTVQQIVAVPVDKVERALQLIQNVLNKPSRKITLNQLQKICGFLNFLCRSVFPGRAFTRRLYSHTKGCNKLKPHHHLRVTSDMREDLTMWSRFLNDPSVYCRGFMDFDNTWNADQIAMYSDTSKNPDLGYGAVCQDSWTYGQWDSDFMVLDPSIEYLELYALVVGVVNWIHRFSNRRIILFCDNQSVVSMVNKTTSSCLKCLKLIRILVFHSLKCNVRVYAR